MRHPGRWLWLILLVPIGLGVARLRFDVEIFDLLPSDLPVVKGLKLYQEYFANARELIITLRARSPELAEEAAQSIALRLRRETNLVASVIWKPPWLEHPDQAGELLAYLWLNQPPAAFNQLTNSLGAEKLPAALVQTREQLATTLSPEEIGRAGYDPFGLTRLPEPSSGSMPGMGQGQEGFISNDGRFRVLYVKAARDLPTYRECDDWLGQIKRLTILPGRVKIQYTGRPAFVAEISKGMQHDVQISVGGTAVIIAILFWLAHRRIKPMLWLLTLLGLILGSTLALGGLIFGSINVVSMGFAAILLGLAVDYAVVHYQEALAHPDLSIPEVRGAIAPSIFWAAVTTISAFLVLNFGGLPGLGQLGSLVALGVGLSALIMIYEFLPPLFPERRKAKGQVGGSGSESGRARAEHQHSLTFQQPGTLRLTLVRAFTGGLILCSALSLLRGFPRVDPTADALRPRNSPSYGALDELKRELNQGREPLWVIVGGSNEVEVAGRLDTIEPVLEKAKNEQVISDFTLPSVLWPRPELERANRAAAESLLSERALLKNIALTNGFSENALVLTDRIFDSWQRAVTASGVYWPSNQLCEWLFEKVTVRGPAAYLALGLINADAGSAKSEQKLAALETDLQKEGAVLSGWELLGKAVFSRVKSHTWLVLTPMIGLVVLSLLLAFRRPAEIMLSLAVLLLSGFSLLALMRFLGWSWNLLNLMALPLILGTGVDYSIFMQLALRRYRGDLRKAYDSVGRALLLCGGTACAGFGSLAFSTNAGMGSLGQVCAAGIGFNMLISIFLLPVWWHGRMRVLLRKKPLAEDLRQATPSAELLPRSAGDPAGSAGPSSLYREETWRLGLALVRVLGPRVFAGLAVPLAKVYWFCAPHRREIVIRNLLPAVGNDERAARKRAKDLFGQFALKLIDLWRYEAGLPLDESFGESTGWEHFEAAQNQRRGVLLLTPHLGNWEFGAPWLAKKGINLQVITMPEPTQDFTKLRQASRARWKIETLVIGEDPFAFLEVIKRLESGATVALLVDRPPPPTALQVRLFGRPFSASIAAAELARASGCVLLPVYLPRSRGAYAAHVLPPVPYDRALLRDRNARQQLTQAIMNVFEPIIREHLDQWYHFVPVWPEPGTSSDKIDE